MHSVCTFVLRLFFDPHDPGEIKGSIQNILEPTPIPFNNLAGLVALIEHLSEAPQGNLNQPYSKMDGGEL